MKTTPSVLCDNRVENRVDNKGGREGREGGNVDGIYFDFSPAYILIPKMIKKHWKSKLNIYFFKKKE